MDITEIRNKRNLLRHKIRNCIAQGKDSRELCKNYENLNKMFISMGGKPKEIGYISNPIKLYKKKPIHNPVNHDDNKHYYKINISWENNLPAADRILASMQAFFKKLGLERLEYSDVRTISYKFKGSEDSFIMLKRSAAVACDLFSNNNPDIVIYGTQI